MRQDNIKVIYLGDRTSTLVR